MRRATLTLLAALGTGSGTLAQPVSGPDLVRELTGNTLTGYNGSLMFSEYHAPDGRVLGHNGGRANRDSCWQVRGDAVCYYYPAYRNEAAEDGREFCWRFERAGANGYRITFDSKAPGRSGIVLLQAGNAYNHGSDVPSWTCDRMISRHSSPRPTALAGRPLSAERSP